MANVNDNQDMVRDYWPEALETCTMIIKIADRMVGAAAHYTLVPELRRNEMRL